MNKILLKTAVLPLLILTNLTSCEKRQVSFSFARSTEYVAIDDSYEITPNVLGFTPDELVYKVADEKIATFKDNVIKGVGVGKTTLTVSTKDGIELDHLNIGVYPDNEPGGYWKSDDKKYNATLEFTQDYVTGDDAFYEGKGRWLYIHNYKDGYDDFYAFEYVVTTALVVGSTSRYADVKSDDVKKIENSWTSPFTGDDAVYTEFDYTYDEDLYKKTLDFGIYVQHNSEHITIESIIGEYIDVWLGSYNNVKLIQD